MFDARSVSHIKWRQFQTFLNKYGHWELAILHNTDKSSTFFNWKARAILRLWVLNKRRSYFWHMLGDWLQRPDRALVNWLICLSISSAPVQCIFSLDYYRSSVTHCICRMHSQLSLAYADGNLVWRRRSWNLNFEPVAGVKRQQTVCQYSK